MDAYIQLKHLELRITAYDNTCIMKLILKKNYLESYTKKSNNVLLTLISLIILRDFLIHTTKEDLGIPQENQYDG